MAEGAWSMLEGGRNGPVGRVVMSGPGGEYTMSRGVGWLTGPSSSSRSVQVGRWPDGRKKSGGSAGAAFSGREIGSRQGGSTPSSGQSGLGVEYARDKLVGGVGRMWPAWLHGDVRGGKKGTTYAAKLH